MKKVYRVFFAFLSVVTGLTVLLLLLFLLRVPLLGPVIKNIAASRLEDALGAGGSYTIKSLEGSYVTNVDVRGVRLTPPEGSKIRDISMTDLVIRYDPLEFLGRDPMSAIKSVYARGLVITLDPDAEGVRQSEVLGSGRALPERKEPPAGQEGDSQADNPTESGESEPREPEPGDERDPPGPRGTTGPGDRMLSILRNVPADLFVDVEGLVVVLSGGDRYEIPVAFDGTTAAEIRIDLDVPSSLSPWAVPPLVFTSDSTSFILASRTADDALGAEARETPEIRISATAEATESGDGAISRVEASFLTDQIDVRLDATPRSISTVASLGAGGIGTIREMLRKFTGEIPPIGLGSVNFQLDLEAEPDAPDFFLEYLLEHPLTGQEYLSGSGDLRARDWSYRNIPLGLINGNFEWHNDLLSIIGLRVEASGIFTVTADSLTLDPRKNLAPVNLEQLDVSITDLIRFLDLLGRDDVPFGDILGQGLNTSFRTESGREAVVVPAVMNRDMLKTSGAGGIEETLMFVLASGIRQDVEAAPELPFANLPFSVSTGDISLKNGLLTIGRFKAEAGKSFSLDVKNLTLDPGRKFAPTGLDSVSLVVNDARTLARLLLKKDMPVLELVSGGTLSAHREETKLLLDTLTVRGKDLSVTAGGDLEFVRNENPTLAFNLTGLKADIPRLTLNSALSGSLDLTDYSGSVSVSGLSAAFRPDGNKTVNARLRGGAEAAWDAGGVSASVTDLEALGGRLSFSGENRDRLAAEFDLVRLSIDEALSTAAGFGMKTGDLPRFSGAVSANGSFVGELKKTGEENALPVFSVTVATNGFSFEEEPGVVSFGVRQDENGLGFSNVIIDLNRYGSITGGGLLPFALGPDGVKLTAITDADFSLQGKLASIHDFLPESAREFVPDIAPELRLSIGSEPGTAELFLRAVEKNVRPSGPLPPAVTGGEFQIRAAVSGITTGTWRTSARILTEQNTLLSGDISLRPGTGWTVLNIGERLMNATIDGEARFYLPLERFASYIPQVQNLTGVIEGQINPSGTLKNPLLTGNMRIRDTSVRIDADIPSLDGLSGVVFFENNAFTVNSFDGFLGHAPFTLQGYLDLSRAMEIQEADLTFVGTNILVARNQDLRVRADADISVTGGNDRLSVTGKIALTDALYTKKIPLFSTSSAPSVGEGLQFFSIRGPIGERTDLDLRITAAETLTIDTNLYRGPFSLDLRVRGTAAVPIPSGRIFTDEGRVLLPFSTVDIQDAQVRFTQEDPFSPQIDARGQTVMQNYNLHVNVSGNYPAIEVNVTSSPPLDSDEAILLLATGNSTLDVFSAQGAISTTRTIGTYLGKEILQRLVGPGNPDESTFFDRLDIAIGQEISRAGQETITIEYRIGRNSPWYVIVERDRHDNFNAGVAWRLWFR